MTKFASDKVSESRGSTDSHVKQYIPREAAARVSRSRSSDTLRPLLRRAGRSGASSARLPINGPYRNKLTLLLRVPSSIRWKSKREDSHPSTEAIPLEVVPIIAGAALYLIYWFRYLVDEKDYPASACNELTGGAIAGIVGEALAGSIGGYWFGLREDDPVSSGWLIWAAVAGLIFVVFGALRYDFQGNLRNLWRAFIVSLLAAVLLGVFGIFLVDKYKMDSFLRMGDTQELAIRGGAYLGAAVGLILGLQIGLALLLYRLMEVPQETNE